MQKSVRQEYQQVDELKPNNAFGNAKQMAFVYLIFFLSGAAALIYEISWSRQIGLLFGHTVHAASIVLASYLYEDFTKTFF